MRDNLDRPHTFASLSTCAVACFPGLQQLSPCTECAAVPRLRRPLVMHVLDAIVLACMCISLKCCPPARPQDKAVKDRIDARNKMETYLYNMKSTAEDKMKDKVRIE